MTCEMIVYKASDVPRSAIDSAMCPVCKEPLRNHLIIAHLFITSGTAYVMAEACPEVPDTLPEEWE